MTTTPELKRIRGGDVAGYTRLVRLRINLIGPPRLEVGGRPSSLSGRKPWLLVALLILSERPPSRRELVERLWPEAEDPLGAMRWSLHQARRALGEAASIVERDGRLHIEAHGNLAVDALEALSGALSPDAAEAIPSPELLEGCDPDDAPLADQWLILERARIRSAVIEAWRTSALTVAAATPERALRLVERILAADPFDDAAHELVIDLHLGRGDRRAAEAHLAHVERRYREELGSAAPDLLRRPFERERATMPAGALVSYDVAARAILDLARARLDAGDYAGAVEAARRAASDAARADDPALEARALLTLASTLIHSVRGRDHEAHGLLDRALQLATAAGDTALEAEVERERGWIAFLEADYGAAEAILTRVLSLAAAAGNEAGMGRALTVIGASRSDRAEFAGAERALDEAIERLDRADDPRWAAFARSFRARAYLRSGRHDAALAEAAASVAGTRATGWVSLAPWPMVVLGEAQLTAGIGEEAAATFGEAFTLAEDIGDPCWEAFAERGLALGHLDGGRADEGRRCLEDALGRCRRLSDTYKWAEAVILVDLIELDRGADPEHLAAALRLVQRGPMPDLAARLAEAVPA